MALGTYQLEKGYLVVLGLSISTPSGTLLSCLRQMIALVFVPRPLKKPHGTYEHHDNFV